MSDLLWTLGGLCFMVAGWSWMASIYARAYRPLRWPYKWAAHGLLLFGRRAKNWEKTDA